MGEGGSETSGGLQRNHDAQPQRSVVRTAVVSTIRNEADNIERFLESIFSQTMRPDEVILSDGGSTDETVQLIRRFIERMESEDDSSPHCTLRLISLPGANRAVGRNAAISASTADVIAVTDAGCRLDERWLENIVQPFISNSDVTAVAGFYCPDPQTPTEVCIGAMTLPSTDYIDRRSFLPSSRSVAFTKIAWREAGGYPEHLSLNEDTPFDLNMIRAGHEFVFEPQAIVFWRPRRSPAEVFRQFRAYARGDGQAGIFARTYLAIYLRYLALAACAAITVVAYSQVAAAVLYAAASAGWVFRLARDMRKVAKAPGSSILALCSVFSVRVAIDLGDMAGYLHGLWEKMSGRLVRSPR